MKTSLSLLLLCTLISTAASAGETEKNPTGQISGCTVGFEISFDKAVARILEKKGYFAPNPENAPVKDADFTFTQLEAVTQDISHVNGKYYEESYRSVLLGFSAGNGIGIADRDVPYNTLLDRATYALKKNAFARDLPTCEEAKKLATQLGE